MSKLVVRVSVRMYQVGFGDCFLLSFEYDGPASPGTRAERHMLIDFGRNHRPRHGGDMEQIAKSIKDRCGGDLDVIVVTHRHEDHLSAFGQKSVAKLIGDCSPPADRPVMDGEPRRRGECRPAGPRREPPIPPRIRAARSFAAQVAEGFALDATDAGRAVAGPGIHGGREPGRGRSVARLGPRLEGGLPPLRGDVDDRQGRIPGVTFELLGPPTPTQFADIAKQADDHPEEFWHLWQKRLPMALAGLGELQAADPAAVTALLAAADGEQPAPDGTAATPGDIGPVRWLTEGSGSNRSRRSCGSSAGSTTS